MTDDTPAADGGRSLGGAFRTMPKWKWLLMAAGLTLGVLGVGGQVASKTLRHEAPVAQAGPTHAAPTAVAPPGSSGFVGGGVVTPDPTPQQPPTAVPASPTLTEQVTPYMATYGFSFVVGLVTGLIFRTFLGFAAMLTGLVVAAALGLSYFHVVNVDLSAVKAQSSQASSWIAEQAGHFKDLLFAHLPSAGAAGAGFLVGMKRR